MTTTIDPTALDRAAGCQDARSGSGMTKKFFDILETKRWFLNSKKMT